MVKELTKQVKIIETDKKKDALKIDNNKIM